MAIKANKTKPFDIKVPINDQITPLMILDCNSDLTKLLKNFLNNIFNFIYHKRNNIFTSHSITIRVVQFGH